MRPARSTAPSGSAQARASTPRPHADAAPDQLAANGDEEEDTHAVHSADFAQYVFLGSQLFARALVLGLIPTLAVTLVACLIANRT